MRMLRIAAVAAFVVLSVAWSCGQNGPTQPAVQLTFTQSTSSGITSNCVYRCTVASGSSCTPAPPAINAAASGKSCSTGAITSYIDTTVAQGASYSYDVTAEVGSAESGYSNVVTAAVPINPSAPSGLNTPVVTQLEPGTQLPLFRRAQPDLKFDARCGDCVERTPELKVMPELSVPTLASAEVLWK